MDKLNRAVTLQVSDRVQQGKLSVHTCWKGAVAGLDRNIEIPLACIAEETVACPDNVRCVLTWSSAGLQGSQRLMHGELCWRRDTQCTLRMSPTALMAAAYVSMPEQQ